MTEAGDLPPNGDILRDEPGLYRMTVRYEGSSFRVKATSQAPVALTLRVEDAWGRLPEEARRYRYRVTAAGDAIRETILENVAPDARIQFDLSSRATFLFEPA